MSLIGLFTIFKVLTGLLNSDTFKNVADKVRIRTVAVQT